MVQKGAEKRVQTSNTQISAITFIRTQLEVIIMATQQLQRKAFKRSSLVSGGVEFAARKLIYFVILQLVLSSFVLITADTLNGSQNNNDAALAQESSSKLPKLTPLQHSSSRFGCATNRISDRTECTGGGGDDGVLKTERAFNETDGKTTKENLILWRGANNDDDDDANATKKERPFRDDDNNLSLTENASIRNQSRRTITSNSNRSSMKTRHRRQPSTDGGFNKDDGERVLSRKRRYLIFPPGSSIQIGKLYLHFFYFCFAIRRRT